MVLLVDLVGAVEVTVMMMSSPGADTAWLEGHGEERGLKLGRNGVEKGRKGGRVLARVEMSINVGERGV